MASRGSLKTGKTFPNRIILAGNLSKTAWVDGYPSMINLIASELSLFFGPLTPARLTAIPFAHMVRIVNNVFTLVCKKSPRCRVNEMIKPKCIRWAVLESASGNQLRFP